jgi:plasmid maintenance system antidote protein VapI
MQFEKFKGIHPGLILARELKERKLAQRPFALSLPEYPQTFNAIIKGRRSLNTALALKIEKALDLEEGTMMILQVYYDIKKEKQANAHHPDLSIIRRAIFWDTELNKIDWDLHYKYVITRVFERGNQEEKKEILRFYGKDKIKEITGKATSFNNSLPIMSHLKAPN